MGAITATTQVVHRDQALTPDHPDHWLNVALGAGGIMAVIGAAVTIGTVIVGWWLSRRYGRRASVRVAASAHTTQGGIVIACRPSVKAVGIFPVKFEDEGGAVLKVTEIVADRDGIRDDTSRVWEMGTLFTAEYVDSGEELTTSVLFPIGTPVDAAIGWRVSIAIRAPQHRWITEASVAWNDRVFVARPDANVASVGAGERKQNDGYERRVDAAAAGSNAAGAARSDN